MGEFDQLMAFIKDRFPPDAVVMAPGSEVAVDGLIFRPNPLGGLTFLNENGEQVVTLAEAIGVLEDELRQYE